MAKSYKNGKQIQCRSKKGQFSTPCLDAQACPECRAVVLPVGVRFNKKYPEHCPQCDAALSFEWAG